MKDKGKTKKTPPVLFLDVDGVLNGDRTFLRRSGSKMDWEKVKRLNRILSATGANVVLSTAWRAWGVDYVRDYLVRAGFKFPGRIIDKTCDLALAPRGWEIYSWLREHPEVKRFAIVDDWDEMEWMKPRHVHTDGAIGMTDADADRLIRLLREDRPVVIVPEWAGQVLRHYEIEAERVEHEYRGFLAQFKFTA